MQFDILWNYHSNLWKTCLFSVQANILEPRYRQMLQHKNCPVHISSCVSIMTTTIIICLYVRIKISRQITMTALKKYFKVNRSPNTPTKLTVVWKPWHTTRLFGPGWQPIYTGHRYNIFSSWHDICRATCQPAAKKLKIKTTKTIHGIKERNKISCVSGRWKKSPV